MFESLVQEVGPLNAFLVLLVAVNSVAPLGAYLRTKSKLLGSLVLGFGLVLQLVFAAASVLARISPTVEHFFLGPT